jgi:hypothetical protein
MAHALTFEDVLQDFSDKIYSAIKEFSKEIAFVEYPEVKRDIFNFYVARSNDLKLCKKK